MRMLVLALWMFTLVGSDDAEAMVITMEMVLVLDDGDFGQTALIMMTGIMMAMMTRIVFVGDYDTITITTPQRDDTDHYQRYN